MIFNKYSLSKWNCKEPTKNLKFFVVVLRNIIHTLKLVLAQCPIYLMFDQIPMLQNYPLLNSLEANLVPVHLVSKKIVSHI
jgi:hypothetical protein